MRAEKAHFTIKFTQLRRLLGTHYLESVNISAIIWQLGKNFREMGKRRNSRENGYKKRSKGKIIDVFYCSHWLIKVTDSCYTHASELVHTPLCIPVISVFGNVSVNYLAEGWFDGIHSQLFEAGGVTRNSLVLPLRPYLQNCSLISKTLPYAEIPNKAWSTYLNLLWQSCWETGETGLRCQQEVWNTTSSMPPSWNKKKLSDVNSKQSKPPFQEHGLA